MTQAQLADVASLREHEVMAIEAEQAAATDRALDRLAKALQCRIRDLVGHSPPKIRLKMKVTPAETAARRRESSKRTKELYPDASYRGLKRWREVHREEYMRQDRMYKQLKRPGKWCTAWLRILEHYEHTCLACKKTGLAIIADHVKPVSQGGDNHPSNLQPLCRLCNGLKVRQTKDYRQDKGAWCASLMPTSEQGLVTIGVTHSG